MIVDGVSQGQVSATSGYAVVQVAYDGVTYFAQVPFSVNVAKFTGVVAFDNKGYKSQFEETATRLKNTATKDELTQATSKFEQTARQISLTVSEKAMGRRNMLPGSALRKMGEGWGASLVGDWLDGTYTVGYYGDQGVLTSDGIGGSNCFKAKCYYDGNTIQYPGMRWNGSAGVRNIKIKSGKKYTISAWVKCDRTDMDIALECLWQPGEKTGSNERKGAVPSNGFYHYLTEVNTWTLITTTIDTTNAPYSYIEVNLFITHRQSGVTATAWFCRPMMEEGDTYNGWTPSPQDYDYIGGNLLDNTASLSLGGNLTYTEGTIIKNGYEPDINASYAKAPANSHAELVQFGEGTNDPIALSPNTDYIFSFWAKGTSLTAYAYRNNNNAEMVMEDCNGNFRSSTKYDDGNTYFTLTNQWKRYWVHWRTKSRTDFIPQMILLRTSSEAWIAKPKLEVGCTITDWTEKRTDMVDRQALLATGIDITNGKITITANNTIFRDNNGTTIALFTGGKINASLIDADQIEVKHLWAKSNDGASKVGYFGNTEEDACKIGDYTVAPLFIGGATAKESPFYVTSKGAMHATSGYIGGFSINQNSLYYGNPSKWATTKTENLAQVGWNFIRIAQAIANGGNPIAYQKIGIGGNAYPGDEEDSSVVGSTAMYIYRSMLAYSEDKAYKPAAIIESDNAQNRNIALKLIGGLQVHGGVIQHGCVMTYEKKGDANVLNLSFSTIFTLRNTMKDSMDFFFPSLPEVRQQLGIWSADVEFCIPVTVIAAANTTQFAISTQLSAANTDITQADGGRYVDNNGMWDYGNDKGYGGNRIVMRNGDCWSFSLTFTKAQGYYIQILNKQI